MSAVPSVSHLSLASVLVLRWRCQCRCRQCRGGWAARESVALTAAHRSRRAGAGDYKGRNSERSGELDMLDAAYRDKQRQVLGRGGGGRSSIWGECGWQRRAAATAWPVHGSARLQSLGPALTCGSPRLGSRQTHRLCVHVLLIVAFRPAGPAGVLRLVYLNPLPTSSTRTRSSP